MTLRDLTALTRLGLTFLVLVLLGGLVASAGHMYSHHENRDGQAGLTATDIEGHYHGVQTRAPLLKALERKHPETQSDENRAILIEWLKGDRVSQDYDSLDLGDLAPAEIIASDCLSCHARDSGNDIARQWPLDFWTDVSQIAISREVFPVDTKVLLASTHTHAISLAVMSLAVAALLLATRFHRGLAGLLVLGAGVGLGADLGGWWLAQNDARAIWLIIGGGTLYTLTTVLSLLIVLIDLWWPRRRAQASSAS